MAQTRQLRAPLPRRCANCKAQHRCLFFSLPARLLTEIQLIAELRCYSRGYTVFREGERATGFFIVRSGWVKLFKTKPGGRRTVSEVAGPGTPIGLLAAISGTSHNVGAETLEDSELEYVQGDLFSKILSRTPSLAIDLLRAVGEQSQKSQQDWHGFSQKLSSTQRLVRSLEELAETCGAPGLDGIRLQIPITVQDLADRIGCSRQWTTKLLSGLEAKHVLRRQQGWIVLMNTKAKR